jgi:predicted PurR-regulated permease PerM
VNREPAGHRPQRPRAGGWAVAAVLAALAIIVYAARYALLPFVFAAAIAFVADPLIVLLQRRLKSPRWLVASLLYAVFLAAFGTALYRVGGTAAADFLRFAARAPQILEQFIAEALGPRIEFFGHVYSPAGLTRKLVDLLSAATGTGGLAQLALSAGTAALDALLLLVLLPYFLISGPRLAAGAIRLLPPERRPSVEALLPKLVPVLRRYLVGLAAIVLYAATIAWIGFGAIFRLPHAPLLAITMALLELVPVVGPLAALTIVGLLALQQTSVWTAVLVMAFVVGLRVSIDDLVGPLVLGQAARLHPVVVILAFVCGAMLFGILGLLLAVPAAVSIKTTLEHYYAEPARPEGRR